MKKLFQKSIKSVFNKLPPRVVEKMTLCSIRYVSPNRIEDFILNNLDGVPQGDIGEYVITHFSKNIFSNDKLREWYDSNCYRTFEGREADEVHNVLAVRDILILKENTPNYNLKPVVVVEGSSTQIKNNKRVNMYRISLYCVDHKVTGTEFEISPGVKVSTTPQDVLKSFIEENYVKINSVETVSMKEIREAIAKYK